MVTTHELHVHPANRSQFDAWDGEEGGFWAAHAEHFDRSVARYQAALFDAAGIRPIDRVLDIGCGTGATSRDAARRAADGSVLALDLSAATPGEIMPFPGGNAASGCFPGSILRACAA